MTNRFLLVILPLDEAPAAFVAGSLQAGGMELHVKGLTTGLARSASGEAADKLLLPHLQAHDPGRRSPELLEHSGQGFGLRHGSGEPVEEIPLPAIGFAQAIADDADHDLLRDP